MKLEIENDELVIKLNPYETLLSFRNSLRIPLDRISGISTDNPGWVWGMRAPGTQLPFLVKMGTYLVAGGREFWVMTAGKPYLVIDMEGWDHKRVVLTMGDNKMWAERIRQACGL